MTDTDGEQPISNMIAGVTVVGGLSVYLYWPDVETIAKLIQIIDTVQNGEVV